MLAQMRNLAFGPVQLRMAGPLCAVPWPPGADEVASSVADGIEVTSEIVPHLPPVRDAITDGRIWRCEHTSNGLRYAVIADGRERVIADITWRPAAAWHVRVLASEVSAAAWFDVLMQIVVSTMAPQFGGVAMHGACVAIGERAVVLAGTSGVGKTTLAGRLIAAGASPLSHDRTLVFPGWTAIATPWGHDGRLAGAVRSLPLSTVLVLKQGLTNASTRLHGARGVMRVAGSMVGGWTAKAVTDAALGAIAQLVTEVPCFATELTNDERATQHVMELLA